jgi:hypothetical protein
MKARDVIEACVKPAIRSISEASRRVNTQYQPSLGLSSVMLALAVLSGCAARGSVQNNPSANQKIVFASANSTEGCQAEMNNLAQGEVHMISDDRRLMTSIFSLGIVHAHQCIGVVKDTSAAPPAPINNE